MALQIAADDAFGNSHPQAYARATNFTVDYVGLQASFVVSIYRDGAARLAGKLPVDQRRHELSGPAFVAFFDVEVAAEAAPDIRTAIYTYLRTLPGYEGAIDV